MDGYALRAEDTDRVPARLRLVGTITAGTVANVVLQKGQVIAITTGAPVPEGADAVCMMEHTRLEGGNVTIGEPVAPGENVRWPGEDIPRGSAVFEAGTVLSPAHLGVLASLGFTQVTTFPRPRVGVLSTGNELVDGTRPLQPGKIRDSNRHSLLALTRSAGCESADHMKTVLGRLGAGSLRWMEILIRPAKPFGFATLTDSEVPVLCLPGNPVAAMVSFELLARSAFRLMGGHALLERPALLALTDGPMSRRRDGTLHLVRVIARVDAEGRLHVRPIGGEGSHLLRAMALANALALVPDGDGVAAEKPVRVILLDAEELELEKVPT
jgi:molybdopterin biosynthesis enzyme